MRWMAMTKGFATALVLITSAALADVNLRFDELPVPVQKTVERELRGGRILEIEREDEHGTIVYEIEYEAEGRKYELDVAPDGTLLRRHRD